MTLAIISDATIAQIADRIDFAGEVRRAFVATAKGAAHNAPVIRGPSDSDQHGINVKFGALLDAKLPIIGGKIGTYWPENVERGLANHSATTLLLNPATGYPQALVAARMLNRLRTAAGDALAVDALARDDATRLTLIGAGAQALFEVRAIVEVRRLEVIYVVSRNPERGRRLVEELSNLAPQVGLLPMEQAVRNADIIVTTTSARAPLFAADLVSPGTHISAMGADAIGKQELDPTLLQISRVFADQPEQAGIIGECQHLRGNDVYAIGSVLSGELPGRETDREITIFDSCGLAVQDLSVTNAALQAARDAGLIEEVQF